MKFSWKMVRMVGALRGGGGTSAPRPGVVRGRTRWSSPQEGRKRSRLTQNRSGEGFPSPSPPAGKEPGQRPHVTSLGAWLVVFFSLGEKNVIFGSLPERRGCWLGAQPRVRFGFPPPLGTANNAESFLSPRPRHAESQQKHMAEKMPAK